MNWIELTTASQLEIIKAESQQQPVIIFKHSTTCSISRAVLDRLQRNWNKNDSLSLKPYFLDLLAYRSISNQIASEFNVQHESPQAIILYQGKPVYTRSHFEIDLNEIKRVVNNQAVSKD